MTEPALTRAGQGRAPESVPDDALTFGWACVGIVACILVAYSMWLMRGGAS